MQGTDLLCTQRDSDPQFSSGPDSCFAGWEADEDEGSLRSNSEPPSLVGVGQWRETEHPLAQLVVWPRRHDLRRSLAWHLLDWC